MRRLNIWDLQAKERRLFMTKEQYNDICRKIERAAMVRVITVPDKYREWDGEVSGRNNEGCSDDIRAFYKSGRRTFDDYKELRIHKNQWGKEMDYMSKLDPESILYGREDDKEILKIVKGNRLVNDHEKHNDLSRAVRWFGRGLTLEDAIRKALVDGVLTDETVLFRYVSNGWPLSTKLRKDLSVRYNTTI